MNQSLNGRFYKGTKIKFGIKKYYVNGKDSDSASGKKLEHDSLYIGFLFNNSPRFPCIVILRSLAKNYSSGGQKPLSFQNYY